MFDLQSALESFTRGMGMPEPWTCGGLQLPDG